MLWQSAETWFLHLGPGGGEGRGKHGNHKLVNNLVSSTFSQPLQEKCIPEVVGIGRRVIML